MSSSSQPPLFGQIPQTGPDTARSEWINTGDGMKHFVRCWAGAIGAPVCLYLHGIEGHGRWIEETALTLQKNSLTIYAPDRRGAGASPAAKGHIGKYERLVLDCKELLRLISNRHPASQVFVIANCWGAKVAIKALATAANEHFHQLGGLVLTSPAVAVKVDVDLSTKVNIALNYIFGGGKKYFDIPLTAQHFTNTPVYLEYIEQDPLRLKQATAAFLVEGVKLTAACRAASKQLSLPLLVLQSGDDRIVDVEGIKQWFNTVPAQDKTLKIFPQAAHSLDFDPAAAEYKEILSSWILARSRSGERLA